MSERISIVLVEPENSSNIGSVARAMKNMGFFDLRLVKPPENWLDKATILAVSAADVLKKTKIFSSVKAAVADAHAVVGTSRRIGAKRGQFENFEKAIQKINRLSVKQKVSILFGKESKGLDNETLKWCDFVITIPTEDVYPSINLAQAVMIIVFELFSKKVKIKKANDKPLFLTKKQTVLLLRHLETILEKLQYHPDVSERIQATFQRFIKRKGIVESEAQMFRGIFRRIEQKTSPR